MSDMWSDPSEGGQAAGLAVVAQASQLGLVGNAALSVPMPFESEIVLYDELRIAGTTHVRNIASIVTDMPDESQFALVREPNNQADAWAIRVEYQGKKIGYIPADSNFLLARLMDGGKTLRGKLVSCELKNTWWKIKIQVSLID